MTNISINDAVKRAKVLRRIKTQIGGRQDFNTDLANLLETGADNLVRADINEESATLLALKTRRDLAVTALSLTAESDRSVLRLFSN